MRILLLIALATVAAGSRTASSQTMRLTVSGVVRTPTDSSPLEGVTVSFPAVNATTRTDASGRFRLDDIPASALRLSVTRLGYTSIDSIIDVLSTPMVLWLQPSAKELAPVSVSAPGRSAAPASASLMEFELRRKAGRGRFITAAELRKEDERGLVKVLRTHLTGVAFEYATDGVYAYSPSQQPPQALNRKEITNCHVQIVVDGVSIYQQDATSARKFTPPNLAEYMTRNLDGIEYYSNPSNTPAEFRTTGAACGTLVLWTRRK